MASIEFVTDGEWNVGEKYDGTDPILKWKDVPQKFVFSLVSIEEKSNTDFKFDTFILHFVDKENEAYKAFAPAHFIKQIRKNRQMNQRPFFCSHGTVEKGNHTVASFELMYRDTHKEWDIFEEIQS